VNPNLDSRSNYLKELEGKALGLTEEERK